ncbi:pyridoxal 5'-phosphate synthase glutaminase subunit PdxT [Methanosarcinales archaeon ex4572_44]|nr:MAG: pyridoxal 5'-phosphate synthase glutaminase subunit PdxT [Methanosarcinales archaeon ex4484_138]PHP46259.1 MAG: pyridoxal 5'-phosphate synthase glutaminase subunit PdxT [Methanosarcinales archaeon ex4572_44]RLG25750.1 MAG: pyridoxal 5'-phosphate synthase glutaminase subunit PdxT [Methanosarcinales archaeon]RLG28546.1 MAG: pyridoxal 5'-phosphate synthase glutaminase subunit PdxT [Methanosarcinales archaeon]
MKIGVIAIQGNIEEHIHALNQAMKKEQIDGTVIPVKHRGIIPKCDGIVIPGGESTTLCRLMKKEGIDTEIKNAAQKNRPIFATCAGLIAIAKKGGKEAEQTKQELLGIIDLEVERNAFGRQRESFETEVRINFLETPYNAIFIRAPKITRVGKDVETIATLNNNIIAAKQKNTIALSFHPELTNDTRIHQHYIKLIKK